MPLKRLTGLDDSKSFLPQRRGGAEKTFFFYAVGKKKETLRLRVSAVKQSFSI